MRTDLKFTAMLIGAFLGAGLATPAAAQEGVFLDPVTGDYTIRYRGYGNALGEATFYPRTKVDPVVKSKIRQANDGSIVYRYKVKNGNKSKQNIVTLRVTSHQAIANSQNTPPGWHAGINPIPSDHPIHGGVGNSISWIFLNKLASREGITSEGLAPGAGQEFEFRSQLLPGVGTMSLTGDAPVTEFLDGGPSHTSAVGIAYLKLRQNDFVPRFVAAPRIAVPTPFDAAAVLAGIQKHVKHDMVSMQLIDPALLALIDRGLTQAIAAAQIGNTSSLLHEIKNLHKLLKQEHADVDQDDDDRDDDKNKAARRQIDKLAARVLDFDLKYVENRMKGDKD